MFSELWTTVSTTYHTILHYLSHNFALNSPKFRGSEWCAKCVPLDILFCTKNLLLKYFDILRYIWKEKNASSRQVKSQIFWQLCQKYSFPKHITSTFVLYFLFCVICTDLSASPAAVSKISSLKPLLRLWDCLELLVQGVHYSGRLWRTLYNVASLCLC